jgi:FkbM family methyltransferase
MLSSDDEARLVQEFFGGRTGFLVEVGANEPEIWSQTIPLDLLGWNGVLFEPQPDLAVALRRTRKAQVFAVACSSPENSGRSMPLKLAGPAGIFSSLNTRLPTATAQIAGTISVPVRSLDDILVEARAPREFDFLSIDVEGHEIEVLRGFDFQKWRPRLILIEDIVLDRRLHEFLTSRGYAWMRRTGIIAWYVSAAEAPRIGIAGRLQFFRKYYLGVPPRRLRQTLRRLRTRLGLAGD